MLKHHLCQTYEITCSTINCHKTKISSNLTANKNNMQYLLKFKKKKQTALHLRNTGIEVVDMQIAHNLTDLIANVRRFFYDK